jgi:hypothetical protein
MVNKISVKLMEIARKKERKKNEERKKESELKGKNREI